MLADALATLGARASAGMVLNTRAGMFFFSSIRRVNTEWFSLVLQEEITLQFCGKKLDRKDFFGKSDPFLLFYRTNEDGT